MAESSGTAVRTPLGIYIHVPFCRVHCPYCDFYTYPADRGRQEDFADALRREITLCPRRLLPARYLVETVYFGGGTPSLLSLRQLEGILEALHRRFAVAPEAEISLEANPRDLTVDYLGGLRALGVNRISVGIQSFSDEALAFLGRDHDAGQARQALALVSEWPSWSADLIFGWRGQSRARWIEDLTGLLAWGPPHVSLYQLTIESRTRFGSLALQGDTLTVDADQQAEHYRTACRELSRGGLEQYEISNFARPGFHCRHNSACWRRLPYLGFGPAAHSFIGGRRTENLRSLPRYIARLRQGWSPVAAVEILTPAAVRREELWLGLRTAAGVPRAWLPSAARPLVERARATGLAADCADGRIVLTPAGMAVADEFVARILTYLDPQKG